MDKKTLLEMLLVCALLLGSSLLMSVSWAADVNSASQVQLVSIKGIGIKTAERIIRERQRAGPFRSQDDFALRVKGIGKKRAKRLFDAGLTLDDAAFPGAGKAVGRQSVPSGMKSGKVTAATPKLIKPLAKKSD